jgi:O-antigen/teichoic acid export membrane protein
VSSEPVLRGLKIRFTIMAIRWLRIDRSLGADFSWALSGNLVYWACQWGIILVLVKLGTAAQVGEYALGMALTAPIVLFANFQLRALLASDAEGRHSFSQYMSFRVVSLGAALLLVAGIVAVTQPAAYRATILLIGAAQALDFTSDCYYGMMQKCGRMDRVSKSLMMKGPLSLIALGAAMFTTRSVVWSMAALVAGRLVVLLLHDSKLGFTRGAEGHASAVRFRWDFSAALPLVRMALPLGVISAIGVLSANVPRYFIEAYSGSAALGIYSAIASLISAGSLAISSAGQSILLPVAKACAEFDRAKFRGLTVQVMALGAGLGGLAVVASAVAGRQVLTTLFRPEYGDHADLFMRLMAVGMVGFIVSGQGYVMTAARRLKPQVPLLLVSALVATGASAVLVPRFGILGAADAVLLAGLAQLAGGMLILASIDRQLRPKSEGAYTGTVAPIGAD